MLLYDLSHTSHSQARTGVQRVALELRRAFNSLTAVTDITHDPFRQIWRPLEDWESRSLEATDAGSAKRRGAYWPWQQQVKARLDRRLRQPSTAKSLPIEGDVFFTAEIFTARTGQNLPELFAHLKGPKVAMFHDAIALRMPHLAPASTVGRFPAYLAELRKFDGVVAVSEDSRQSLIDYWRWAGWQPVPEVIVSSHGLDHLRRPATIPDASLLGNSPVPRILSVGSIEGRKNHISLLTAAENLWRQGRQFELQIIGTLQRDTGGEALTKIKSLQAAGHPLRYDGWISDDDLQTAFGTCAFTAYPSLLEGFGLPVWESLIHGVPCICSNQGATAEIALGGGCLSVDTADSAALTESISTLLGDAQRLQQLRQAASQRTSPTWLEGAKRIQDWISSLPSS